ncbi:MAG: LysM peptidoglycan-binding domain-containing protein [Roseibium sp.]|uniref:LysM peptidoglycan-binding domain-containing protein n=1 Tax=Roseibium sp. TaxID=1936156 RepID=UPI003D9C3754
MNKNNLVRTAVVAVPLAIAAIAGAYFYKEVFFAPEPETADTAQKPTNTEAKSEKKEVQASAPAGDDAGKVPGTEETAAKPQQAEAEPDAVPVPPVKGPSFDVVGVEPTGETVVAGRSDAGAMVALTANGEVVGKSIANQAGEWTIILEEPLKPGNYDVGLEVHDEKGASIEESEQRLIVSVPEGGKEQPLVVLNSPDAPSNVLQKPETDELIAQLPAQQDAGQAAAGAEGAQQDEAVVAALPADAAGGAVVEGSSSTGQSTQTETAAAPSPAQETASQSQQAAGSSENVPAPAATAGAPETDGTTETAALTRDEIASPSTDTSAQASDQAGTGTAQTGQSVAGVQPGADAQKPEGTVGGTQTAAGEVSGNGVRQQPETQAAIGATAQQQQQAAANSEPSITVEAVESEPDKVYVAGTGKPGSSVRVYVGEDYQGEAKVNSSGRWLVQGTKNVPEGNVEVRADLIAPDGDTVDARAAVTFEKEQDKQIVLTKVVATGSGSGQGSQGADVQKSLPVVIIRKGDNLWRISRRLYGDGVRYTTIYQANQDQIRDPDLIYPGQVFLTPEGDVNWPDREQDSSNRG